jgi:uncharacterized membrane protein YfcA
VRFTALVLGGAIAALGGAHLTLLQHEFVAFMSGGRGFLGLVVGLPSGCLAGLLGIGGGIWAVPAMSLLLGIRLRHAIATSMLMIIGVALATAIGQSIELAHLHNDPPLHHVAWWLALWLAPGALVGGWCGAGLTHRLPVRWLRYCFQLLLAATGLRLILA